MNPQSKRDYNNKNDDNNIRRTKAIATAIPIAGIIVGAALVSGPFFFLGQAAATRKLWHSKIIQRRFQM